jgi:hypothetical protein
MRRVLTYLYCLLIEPEHSPSPSRAGPLKFYYWPDPAAGAVAAQPGGSRAAGGTAVAAFRNLHFECHDENFRLASEFGCTANSESVNLKLPLSGPAGGPELPPRPRPLPRHPANRGSGVHWQDRDLRSWHWVARPLTRTRAASLTVTLSTTVCSARAAACRWAAAASLGCIDRMILQREGLCIRW